MSEERKVSEDQAGPTGKFPDGKVNEGDRGEIKIQVGCDHSRGLVVINFGYPVSWIAMSAEDCDNLAALIMEKARYIRLVSEAKAGGDPYAYQC
jgi:hypothetical protein